MPALPLITLLWNKFWWFLTFNICFSAEERRRMLHEIEYRDAEVARQVQTRLFKDTGTPPLPMMSNGDVPEAVGGKV